MKDQEFYTPEEVASVAQNYGDLIMNLRAAINTNDGKREEILLRAKKYQDEIPSNVGTLMGLEKRMALLE